MTSQHDFCLFHYTHDEQCVSVVVCVRGRGRERERERGRERERESKREAEREREDRGRCEQVATSNSPVICGLFA